VPDALRAKAVVVPVGATERWYDAAAAGARERGGPGEPLRVVFFGLFTPLQGAVTIGEAIGMLTPTDGVEFTMIGSGQDLDAARAAARGGAATAWVPWVDSAELPGVVARHDVGIGITGTTPKALKVVPNKVYQCAAAGLAVVTSDSAPQRRAFGDAVVGVPPGDAAALAAALRGLATDRGRLAERRAAASAAAERFRPGSAVEPLDERLRATAR
jgi:glycosyltransferase involved in cell wall biosynthesis